MSQHPYGWLSLLPPVVAIALAICTRRVIVSLLAGLVVGALVLAGGDPLRATADLLEMHLWKAISDEDRLRVFAFTLLMGAMVGVINRSGGMRGLVQLISPWANNRRRGQLATWLLGLVVFFDDYVNTLLLGNTLRPLCDRLKISREKLAYLVDSTSAPVAGLALVSTWVAVEIDFVQQGLKQIGAPLDTSAFDLFVHSIPYRFYILWALLFVPLIGWLGRDFGPMLRAERRALRGDPPHTPAGQQRLTDPTAADPELPARWFNAVVPVLVTVLAIVGLLYTTGLDQLRSGTVETEPALWAIFGKADSYYALLWGSLAGLATAVVLVWSQRLLSGRQITAAAGAGAQLMLPALVILWLASSISGMTSAEPPRAVEPAVQAAHDSTNADRDAAASQYPFRRYRFYTGAYIGAIMERVLNRPDGQSRGLAWMLPTVVFLLAAVMAFATGTSWGTMGVLMPLVVPLAYGALAAGSRSVGADDPILLGSIGGVLAGAIFGDHCSPISDTTILSSQASGCDHMAHVRTQLPYAVLVGGLSILLGTLPVGLGAPVWIMLPLGIVAMIVCVLVLGRRVEPSV